MRNLALVLIISIIISFSVANADTTSSARKVTWPPGPAVLPTPEMLSAMDEGLKTAGLQISDMDFNKALAADKLRLQLPEEALHYPITGLRATNSIGMHLAAPIGNGEVNLEDLFLECAGWTAEVVEEFTPEQLEFNPLKVKSNKLEPTYYATNNSAVKAFITELRKHTGEFPQLTTERINIIESALGRLMFNSESTSSLLEAIYNGNDNQLNVALLALESGSQWLDSEDFKSTDKLKAWRQLYYDQASLWLNDKVAEIHKFREDKPEDKKYEVDSERLIKLLLTIDREKLATAIYNWSRAAHENSRILAQEFAEIRKGESEAFSLSDLKIQSDKNNYWFSNREGVILYDAKSGLMILDSDSSDLRRMKPTQVIDNRPAAMILDLGGDDSYGEYSASANGGTGRWLSWIIDLGGHDRYDSMLPSEDTPRPYSFGSGVLGLGAVIDLGADDDYYRAGSFSLASGVFGTGLCLDDGGCNSWEIRGVHGEGAGTFGFGVLAASTNGTKLVPDYATRKVDDISHRQGDWKVYVDYPGLDPLLDRYDFVRNNDTYNGGRYVQAFAGPMGGGLLADYNGNDHYNCGGEFVHLPLWNDEFQSLSQGFGFGWRGTFGGGIGVLYDSIGQDSYKGGIYAQASSYWYALGILIDDAGNDDYNARHYSIGAGIHLSSGFLIDRAGNDLYSCPYGPNIGGAHDLAVGMLVDCGGGDMYQSNGIGLGQGHANGVGFFADLGGIDQYSGREWTLGHAEPTRGFGGIGLFMDLGGKRDFYTMSTGVTDDKGKFTPPYDQPTNNYIWRNGLFGVGVDK